jgi:hypothetical protein
MPEMDLRLCFARGMGRRRCSRCFPLATVPQDFQNGAFMRQPVTFRLNDQHGASEILNGSSVIQVRSSRSSASTRYSKKVLPLCRLERMSRTPKMYVSVCRAKL